MTPEASARLSGDLRVKTGERFRAASHCTLQVAGPEAKLAVQICKRQRSWLHDLGVNIWNVDKPTGVRGCGSFDLECDVSMQSASMPVQGKLWVELKVFGAKGCKAKMANLEKALVEQLQQVHARHEHMSSVLLLVAKVSKTSRTGWGAPQLLAKLFTLTSGQWVDLTAAGVRVGKGQVPVASKLPVSFLWPKIEFHRISGSSKGLFKHFLQGLGLPTDSPGKRAASLNKALQKEGVRGRLVRHKIPNRPGKAVWMGTKTVFKALYKKVL